jgi:hypothetical protein
MEKQREKIGKQLENMIDLKQNKISSLEEEKKELQSKMADPTSLNNKQNEITETEREKTILKEARLYNNDGEFSSLDKIFGSMVNNLEDFIEECEEEGTSTEDLKKEINTLKEFKEKASLNESADPEDTNDIDFGDF